MLAHKTGSLPALVFVKSERVYTTVASLQAITRWKNVQEMIRLCYTSELTTQKRENEKYRWWRNLFHQSATEYLRTAYEKNGPTGLHKSCLILPNTILMLHMDDNACSTTLFVNENKMCPHNTENVAGKSKTNVKLWIVFPWKMAAVLKDQYWVACTKRKPKNI